MVVACLFGVCSLPVASAVVLRCSLSVGCSLMFDVACLCAVCCFGVCWLLFVVSCLLAGVRYLFVFCVLSAACCSLCVVCCVL